MSMSRTRNGKGSNQDPSHNATVDRALARKQEMGFAKAVVTDKESLDEEEVEKPKTLLDVVKEAKKTDARAVDKKSKKEREEEEKATKKAAGISSSE
jgi:hypothetical protein